MIVASNIQGKLDPQASKGFNKGWKISSSDDFSADVIIHHGDTLDFLRVLPSDIASLVISSPPYNIGKEYEVHTELDKYLNGIKPVLKELVRIVAPNGSICWQVGNYIEKGEVYPLDIYYYSIFKELGMQLRNRIIWHFGHGLHATKRLSGRYETILWFTKTDQYLFNLDSVRVPSKYPGKRYYKGKKLGKPSCNPLGKNPSDFWDFLSLEWESGILEIPNVKSNHPEKTIHPCQFPIELVERCVLAFTNEHDWVLDPYGGVGSTAIAALKNRRKAITIDQEKKYIDNTIERIHDLQAGKLITRKIGTPIYEPTGREKISRIPDEWNNQ
jgi:DNA modification methylase